MTDDFPCPACGFLTFAEPPGSYDICDVCGWEDDHVQLAHPRLRGGANRVSLVEAQREAVQRFPRHQHALGQHQRDPEWRPLTNEEAEIDQDAPRSGLAYFHSAAEEEPTYYWRKPRPR